MIFFENDELMAYMPDVLKCDSGILTLNDQWENVELLCEINCPVQSKSILPNMRRVQQSFYDLHRQLLNTLIDETLGKTVRNMRMKAQISIDILIRNLYERTADVGFLATDSDIRHFTAGDEKAKSREYILHRLHDYVAKYTVYEEIVILDCNGSVLINLNDANHPECAADDPIFVRTLESEDTYAESYCKTGLFPAHESSHTFSSVIRDDSGAVCGVLVLFFTLPYELKTIFQRLAFDYDGGVTLVLDEDGGVLASSDENHVPTGIVLEAGKAARKNGVVFYRGREYLMQSVATRGYQGYFGLGWRGCVMLPLALAFKEFSSKRDAGVEPKSMSVLMGKAASFSSELSTVLRQTDRINSSLKQIVFNGQVLSVDDSSAEEYQRLTPILNSIGKIGNSIKELFDRSIQELFATVISSSLQNVSFLAYLCTDIMDRNLYERADDCRWWALNPSFRRILSKEELSAEDLGKLRSRLSYINSLYTVYSNLFIFDKSGTIVAVSDPARAGDVGKVPYGEYVRKTLANAQQEKYFVSEFEPSDLYDDRSTYIYSASITEPDSAPARTVGGIGIVFDSFLQFGTMLREAIGESEDSFAVFTNRGGKIISSSCEAFPVGSTLEIPSCYFDTPSGEVRSDVLVFDGSYCALGCACSSSYREYKSTDGYQNDVLAFVFRRLAPASAETLKSADKYVISQNDIELAKDAKPRKIASFYLSGQLMALSQSVVVEAVEEAEVLPIPHSRKYIKGAVLYKDISVAVADLKAVLGVEAIGGSVKLLICKMENGSLIAFEVDELGSVLEIDEAQIKPISGLGSNPNAATEVYALGAKLNKTILLLDEKNLFRDVLDEAEKFEAAAQ